jgi:cation:H+ antiporter
MTISLLLLMGGFIVLTAGGHYLVEGSVRIALLARISSAVVGLTVVAMGTSMPELAVSLGAAARGATDISYGNVVGSNIFNIAAILALTAIIKAVPVERQTVRLEYPFMVLASWIMLLLSRDGLMDRLEGAFFLFSLVAFVAYAVRLARQDVSVKEAAEIARQVDEVVGDKATQAWGRNVGLIALGIVGLVIGSELMVRGAVTIARDFGITERVIGLTIVAMGTSLPELATSIVAARRNESAIALGNVIGSNIFNVLAILGATSVLIPVPVNPIAISVDNWVMLAFTVALFPMMWLGKRVTRRDGIVLLAGFLAYMIYLLVPQGGGG